MGGDRRIVYTNTSRYMREGAIFYSNRRELNVLGQRLSEFPHEGVEGIFYKSGFLTFHSMEQSVLQRVIFCLYTKMNNFSRRF
jgi:hypothetical protein